MASPGAHSIAEGKGAVAPALGWLQAFRWGQPGLPPHLTKKSALLNSGRTLMAPCPVGEAILANTLRSAVGSFRLLENTSRFTFSVLL